MKLLKIINQELL